MGKISQDPRLKEECRVVLENVSSSRIRKIIGYQGKWLGAAIEAHLEGPQLIEDLEKEKAQLQLALKEEKANCNKLLRTIRAKMAKELTEHKRSLNLLKRLPTSKVAKWPETMVEMDKLIARYAVEIEEEKKKWRHHVLCHWCVKQGRPSPRIANERDSCVCGDGYYCSDKCSKFDYVDHIHGCWVFKKWFGTPHPMSAIFAKNHATFLPNIML